MKCIDCDGTDHKVIKVRGKVKTYKCLSCGLVNSFCTKCKTGADGENFPCACK